MSDSKANANAAILATNGLRYILPKPLSTTLVRTWKKQYSQRQTYAPSDTIVFDLNVSGQVDPEMSYLTFEFKSDQDCMFGRNGLCSIIRDIRIQSKNGVELDRIQSFNAWSQLYLANAGDQWDSVSTSSITGQSVLFNNNAHQIVLPLRWLSGLFRPHVKKQKIPSHMLSGARIEIVLENVNRALKISPAAGASAPTTYTVNNPQLVLLEHTLNDNTLKVLTEESANNGLEYVYDRVFTSIETTNASVVHTQIKKAVSQATKIITTIHDPAMQNDVNNDSFDSVNPATTFSKYQYRLASNYFPHQPVENTPEAYQISQCCWDTATDTSHTPVNTYGNYSLNTFNVGVPLKTEHSISSSGLAVNNSATVALEYEGDGSNKIYYTFLVYTALARCFLSQVTVKI
jgi:BarA-like signal transduction histidine kinase